MPNAKKKAKVISAEELQELAKGAMAQFMEEAKARHKQAHRIYEKQDDETQDAIERMTSLLVRIARRHMWVSDGSGDRVVLTIPEETIYNNMFYMAVEILRDLAEFDVKVAGFHLPTAKKKVKS